VASENEEVAEELIAEAQKIAEEIVEKVEAKVQSNPIASIGKKVHLHISAVINSFTNVISKLVAAIVNVFSKICKFGRK
jgi:diadenosine tetraphosphate (Ap4A) HIT family hydrolase